MVETGVNLPFTCSPLRIASNTPKLTHPERILLRKLNSDLETLWELVRQRDLVASGTVFDVAAKAGRVYVAGSTRTGEPDATVDAFDDSSGGRVNGGNLVQYSKICAISGMIRKPNKV